MQNVHEFVANNSASLLFILGFIVNSIATVVLKNTASRNVVIVILKTIVGALEKAPKVGVLLLAIGASVTQVGCSALPWSKTIYEQWRAVCGKDLASRADVAAEAKARGLGVADFAEALCELSDVVAPFARSTSPGAPKRLAPPGDEAVAVAKALGAMR